MAIDWKVGVFDTIIGMKVDLGNNPNFTRSYGFNIEPTTTRAFWLSITPPTG